MNEIFWSLLEQAVIFYCGYKIGQHITSVKITKMLIDDNPEIHRMVKRARAAVQELDRQHKIKAAGGTEPIHIERIGDQLYLYQKDNNEFLAQGTNLQEALAELERRFPSRKFQGHLSRDEADKLGVGLK